jgi:hypothetical protein
MIQETGCGEAMAWRDEVRTFAFSDHRSDEVRTINFVGEPEDLPAAVVLLNHHRDTNRRAQTGLLELRVDRLSRILGIQPHLAAVIDCTSVVHRHYVDHVGVEPPSV